MRQILLPASNLLQLGDVRDACCEFLQSHLHPTNCLGTCTGARPAGSDASCVACVVCAPLVCALWCWVREMKSVGVEG